MTHSPSVVRPGQPTDSAALRQLQSLLSEPSPQLLSAAINELSTGEIGSSQNRSSVRTWTLLVSPDSNDCPVGYLLAVDTGATHIAELVVDPDHRREKRATALLQHICDAATHPVTVHVAAANESARSLYETIGFIESSRSSEQFETGAGLTLQYDPKNGSQTA